MLESNNGQTSILKSKQFSSRSLCHDSLEHALQSYQSVVITALPPVVEVALNPFEKQELQQLLTPQSDTFQVLTLYTWFTLK